MSLYVLLSSNCLLLISNTVYVSVVISVENGTISLSKYGIVLLFPENIACKILSTYFEVSVNCSILAAWSKN